MTLSRQTDLREVVSCAPHTRLGLAALLLAPVLVSVGCSSVAEDGGNASLSSEVSTEVDQGRPASVLVFLKDGADLSAAARMARKEDKGRFVYTTLTRHATTAQADLASMLSAEGARYRRFHLINAILVEDARPSLVRRLAQRSDVKRISLDKPTPAIALPATPRDADDGVASAAGGNITSTHADRVWSELGVNGAGVVVAGQDTGYAWEHPALKRQYRGWDGTTADHRYSWHDAIKSGSGGNTCGYDLSAPCDDHGHGTHTMGTIVGDDGGSNKVGMAPGARWIGCRNMDAGTGKPSTYLDCFEWLLAPYPQGGDPTTDGKPEMAPNVINNSWGCDSTEGCQGQEFVQAILNLEAAGILMVVSAGNDGSSCGTINSQPASVSDHTLSVGAHDYRSNAIAGFSSRGPSTLDGKIGPDVSAPGVGIRSSLKSGSYGNMSGTSMAGPHVVGEVALVWSAVPALKGKLAETTDIIEKSSLATASSQTCGGVPGSATPNNTFGWGLIDAYAAVTRARDLAPTLD
jgi:subtilisin family serine protease